MRVSRLSFTIYGGRSRRDSGRGRHRSSTTQSTALPNLAEIGIIPDSSGSALTNFTCGFFCASVFAKLSLSASQRRLTVVSVIQVRWPHAAYLHLQMHKVGTPPASKQHVHENLLSHWLEDMLEEDFFTPL